MLPGQTSSTPASLCCPDTVLLPASSQLTAAAYCRPPAGSLHQRGSKAVIGMEMEADEQGRWPLQDCEGLMMRIGSNGSPFQLQLRTGEASGLRGQPPNPTPQSLTTCWVRCCLLCTHGAPAAALHRPGLPPGPQACRQGRAACPLSVQRF